MQETFSDFLVNFQKLNFYSLTLKMLALILLNIDRKISKKFTYIF